MQKIPYSYWIKIKVFVHNMFRAKNSGLAHILNLCYNFKQGDEIPSSILPLGVTI